MTKPMLLGKREPAFSAVSALSYFVEMRKRDHVFARAFDVVRERLAGLGLDDVEQAGSSRFKTSIYASDVDVAVYCDDVDSAARELCKASGLVLKGRRRSTVNSSRIVFSGRVGAVDVDVMLMPPLDYRQLQYALCQADEKLTFENRIEITYAKLAAYMANDIERYVLVKTEFLRNVLQGFVIDDELLAADLLARSSRQSKRRSF